ncbi:MAG: KH domain-containing protein [Streptococcaceae bacterium]|nr:KH domain-containing protein [Streptococcaceae bacterium]
MNKDIKELIMAIVKPLVGEPDKVNLKISESEDYMEYHLEVAENDIGCVIGRQGHIIEAIRTIVYFVPVEGKKVRLLVEQ